MKRLMISTKLRLLGPYVKRTNLRAALEHPRLTLQVLRGIFLDSQNVSSLLGITEGEIDQYIREVIENADFNNQVLKKLKDFESHFETVATGAIPQSLGALVYAIVRVLKPEIVVETGVASGLSSAYILQALEENRKGKLYSIDLPAREGSYPERYSECLGRGKYAIPRDNRLDG